MRLSKKKKKCSLAINSSRWAKFAISSSGAAISSAISSGRNFAANAVRLLLEPLCYGCCEQFSLGDWLAFGPGECARSVPLRETGEAPPRERLGSIVDIHPLEWHGQQDVTLALWNLDTRVSSDFFISFRPRDGNGRRRPAPLIGRAALIRR